MKEKVATVSIIVLLTITIIANTGCFESQSPPPVLGDFAEDYLSGSKYTRLIIEVDYVEGHAPSSKAMETLKARINSYCDKENVLILEKRITTSKSSYSLEDIKDLEKEHRDYHKSGSDIIAYVLYLNGQYSENEDVLGIAYGASSMAIFNEKIHDLSIPFWATTLVDHGDYEKSVLVHEFGHLLAMVNIGYESDRNHEGSYRHHCVHDECVMYHSIETVSILTLLTQDNPQPPSDFYTDCQYDLGKLKSGDY
ncbi:MAG: hypothetical protein JSV09_15530 [Thermoplasmata archaeon]|nr:MAG: hypothetical protein JSV09_15530 [Thermoplasmata archaeon]